LAIRLYLPGVWLREYPALAKRTVPADYRVYCSKPDLALSLVDEVRAQGDAWPSTAAALDAGYSDSEAFAQSLAHRDIRRAGPVLETAGLAAAAERLGWLKSRLGLDHFEGRSWLGWHHHAALVFVAAGLLLLHGAGRRA
jgi:SRSO17 transposase